MTLHSREVVGGRVRDELRDVDGPLQASLLSTRGMSDHQTDYGETRCCLGTSPMQDKTRLPGEGEREQRGATWGQGSRD